MNVDLIAALLTGLTIYSVFITIHYFLMRQKARRLANKLAIQELITFCDGMTDFFKDKIEENKKAEKTKTAAKGENNE